jgi:hypothetical protein
MCFSLAWFQQLFIFAIVVGAIITILYIVATYVLSKLPAEIAEGVGVLARVIKIVMWALFAIFVVYVVFALISCLLSYSGGMPLLPRGR